MAIQIIYQPTLTNKSGGFGGRVLKELLISMEETQKETKMLGKFAVVKSSPNVHISRVPYQFEKFHDTPESARDEAERLARKEKCMFYIVQVVGEVVLKDVETTWDKNFTAHNTIIPF